MRQSFSQKFSVAASTLYSPLSCCHRLENIKIGICNLDNPNEKRALLVVKEHYRKLAELCMDCILNFLD